VLIKRTITLKALVTPALKEEMLRDLHNTLQRLELELQQIEFQGKRLLLDAEKQGVQQVHLHGSRSKKRRKNDWKCVGV